MKINAKLFLLTFTIITLVSVASAFIYHTLTQQLLQSQQSKALVNSANDFIFAFQDLIENIDEEYQQVVRPSGKIHDNSHLDFIFETNSDSLVIRKSFKIKSNVNIYTNVSSMREFLKYNTNLVTRRAKDSEKDIYYGILIDSKVIKTLSEKIRAEVALVEGNVVSNFTNDQENQYYLPYLSRVTRELRTKNNFELIQETIDDIDFSATHFSPKSSVVSNQELDFVIFSISREAADFKNTMNLVTAVIVISGIFLTIIFLFLFTTKFRKQLEFINDGVNNLVVGEVGEHVKIISKDEIGKLGIAFNNMLDEIEKRDLAEKEYSEFISLINQNPSLEKIGNATLQKIINSTNVDVGAFYLYEDNELIPIAVLGLPNKKRSLCEEASFYNKAKDNREIVEIYFEENHPILKTGITQLKISYLFVLPIFYNNEIIAILELASVNKPTNDIKSYLNKIGDQLAIGLANGKALSELQSLVEELQNLNKAYQEQNIQITEKNEELIKLHEKLKRGSKELEIQTSKAIESEKIKSQFLANMSHELRTPQNAILGLTELILKDGSTPTRTKERLNVVLRNGKKLLTLIENILEYSKLESGNTGIKKSKLKLSELVNEVTSFINPLFFERDIAFIVKVPESLDFELETDVKKVEQIIYNLIGNASKFTKNGFVKLELNIEGSSLNIIVEDTGPGISQEDRKIIFDEFRQVDASLNRKFSGTGLGLAICKRYSELLGGTIVVSNAVEQGSVFTVKLPDVVNLEIEKHLKHKEKLIPKHILKALIISDGHDSINLISDYLKSHSIEVEVKSSYQIDISFIEETRPDIIILDILLKQNTGWNLLVDIKSIPIISNTPVIIVNMDEEANCGLGLNIYKYYPESIDRHSIHRAVEQIEEQQSIKLRKILFIMNDESFNIVEDGLIVDELKIYHHNGKSAVIDDIKRYDPDLIIIDLFDSKIESVKTLAEIYNDLFCKSIPVLAFIHRIDQMSEQKLLNNSIFETTLQNQFHPLDVLKVIKDRIELFDSNIFKADQEITKSDTKIQSDNSLSNRNIGSKIKVLIVDDNDDARFTIGEIIESLGYQPEFATNGFECLDKLKVELPDLVLLDIMMPKMDGFQTIKKIREHKIYNNLKVYALTAYAMLTDKEIIEKNGFNGLFTKPINTVQLERKLNQIFDTIT